MTRDRLPAVALVCRQSEKTEKRKHTNDTDRETERMRGGEEKERETRESPITPFAGSDTHDPLGRTAMNSIQFGEFGRVSPHLN